MSTPFVGEIRLVAFSFAPAGWMSCQGQILPISEFDVLFNLIGTTYGGDGQSTFNLPDLQGRTPVHQGQGSGLSPYTIGEQAGVESVTLTTSQIPSHNHPLRASTNAGSVNNASGAGSGGVLGSGQPIYSQDAPSVALSARMMPSAGGSQPHDNLQPFLVLNWIISMFGVFPSPT